MLSESEFNAAKRAFERLGDKADIELGMYFVFLWYTTAKNHPPSLATATAILQELSGKNINATTRQEVFKKLERSGLVKAHRTNGHMVPGQMDVFGIRTIINENITDKTTKKATDRRTSYLLRATSAIRGS